MSTYVWMRLLESSGRRYDFGIWLLSLSHIEKVYGRVAARARGPDVLDLGCGTGNVALRLARRGLRVTGVDLSPALLDMARRKTPPNTAVRWVQTSAVELIDLFPAASFDTITCVLLLSELSEAERRETLRQCHSLLRAGGQLIVADEVRPPTAMRRLLHKLVRLPLAAVTYLITQTSTRPVKHLETLLAETAFAARSRESNRLGTFVVVEAERREVADASAA